MKFRHKQSGVALVITLIMLSVITIIAVAFLALTQRERATLSQTLAGTEAELMASTGLERSKSHIMAEVSAFLSTNTLIAGGRVTFYPKPMGPDLSVSKAFTNEFTLYRNWTNMNDADYEALTNLIYDPQVPVFTTNNSGAYELVDYLDLNRNGRFDPTGIIEEMGPNGVKTGENVFVVGDPQWIGVLARPNEPHSSSNRFVGRYAYVILPAGRTLDINFIHNRGKQNNQPNQYLRSQGHGTWEINLAAFLADLNVNNPAQYPYGWGGVFNYLTNLLSSSEGVGFDHASAILNFRHAGQPLWPANKVFGTFATDFEVDGIDQFANGWIVGGDNDSANDAWPGSSNPQQFFSVHDFFNPLNPSTQQLQQFQDRLRAAGNQQDTYNNQTFYRMLAQLGTDSAPEPMQVTRDQRGRFNSARINLNYNNYGEYDTAGNFQRLRADQFVPWTAETFFHTVADKLLQEYDFRVNNNANVPLSVTNLPVYPTNHYTPAVHRILQMALNVFEGTRSNLYPTALKPMFESQNGGNEIRIVGYVGVPRGNWAITNALNWKDLSNATDRASLNATTTNQFVYGVPVLIGARKGFPNFNEFMFQSIAQVQRKLNFEKVPGQTATTNQAFLLGVSNVVALEAWHSYRTNYPRDVIIAAGVEIDSALTNNEGFVYRPNRVPLRAFSTNLVQANTWGPEEYRIPVAVPEQDLRRAWTNDTFLPYSIYSRRLQQFVPTNAPLATVVERSTYPDRQWVLTTTNRLRFFMFDDGNLIDAVGLAPQITALNITKELHDEGRGNPNSPTPTVQRADFRYWKTNLWRGRGPHTEGVQAQIDESARLTQFGGREAEGFTTRLNALPTAEVYTNFNAPFSPEMKVYTEHIWEANDPLVHHIAQDLRFDTNTPVDFSDISEPNKTGDAIARRIAAPTHNPAYKPWVRLTVPGERNAAVADPNVNRSDDWGFPTNKLATIGMLGRIHRGTPWQTIYFKPDPPDNRQTWPRIHQGLVRSNPTNDWKLADIFTVAQHPNASRGRLSVNQTNVAAWSAILSGVEVPTVQRVGGALTIVTNIIEPNAIDPNKTIEKLVEGINARRGQSTGQVFSGISEFLSVKELTVDSPFLRPPYAAIPFDYNTTPLQDHHFEAIPEKILSLVHRGEPRFVVYAFGQSLKPAAQSILTGGTYRGLVTNYEVTGELATRSVMRVELEELTGPPRVSPRVIVESFNFVPPD
jgi:hypothetical protein